MNLKDLKQVERCILLLCVVIALLFAGSYFVNFMLFYGFLAALVVLIYVMVRYWKCPHCGKNIWYNFDAPCRHCGKDVFEEPEKKPKNTKERTGFFNW
ncbi:MAG: hypothetical protein IJ374_02470 [Lachnospiraceae bacterium]|nr:hypothetical protein [Lachnospiraceae bacterium]